MDNDEIKNIRLFFSQQRRLLPLQYGKVGTKKHRMAWEVVTKLEEEFFKE